MSPLGYDASARVIYQNDTAVLYATLYQYDDTPWPATDLSAVNFTVQHPDGTMSASLAGTLSSEGSGVLNYTGTGQIGHYSWVATFTTIAEGLTKSVRGDFAVEDPFVTTPTFDAEYLLATYAWAKIEDLFDAEEDGPYLQDVTANVFNREKMSSFIDMALFDINYLNPPTNLAIGDFITVDPNTGEASANSNLPVLVQGVFIVCIRHLMTSYVEQPTPTGAQIAWQDRRDYLQRWMQIYQIELTQYQRMAALYKRQFLGLGTVKSLVASKAGRLLPATLRTWSVGRGLY